jgi:hypothetical protein
MEQQGIRKGMDVVEKGTTSLRNASRHWNIALLRCLIICIEKQDLVKQDQQMC